MNVYNLWTEKFCEVDGEKVTLEEALKAKNTGKSIFRSGSMRWEGEHWMVS